MRKARTKLCSGHSPMPCRKSRPRPSLCRYSERVWARGPGRNASLPASCLQRECGWSLPGQGADPGREKRWRHREGDWHPAGWQEPNKGHVGPTALWVPRATWPYPPGRRWRGGCPAPCPSSRTFPRPHFPGASEPQVSTAARHPLRGRAFGPRGHRGPLPPGWEKGRREKLPPQPGRELVPEQGPRWRRKTRGACWHSLHPRSDTAFCYRFVAEWQLQSLPAFEACHREQLGKTRIHLHLSSTGVREDRGNNYHQPDACGDLPSIRIKEENGETDQRDVA